MEKENMLPTRQNSFFVSVPPVKNMITRIIHSHHCHYGNLYIAICIYLYMAIRDYGRVRRSLSDFELIQDRAII
jgi:hypothetical protein